MSDLHHSSWASMPFHLCRILASIEISIS
jgi:hypothetical protein